MDSTFAFGSRMPARPREAKPHFLYTRMYSFYPKAAFWEGTAAAEGAVPRRPAQDPSAFDRLKLGVSAESAGVGLRRRDREPKNTLAGGAFPQAAVAYSRALEFFGVLLIQHFHVPISPILVRQVSAAFHGL